MVSFPTINHIHKHSHTHHEQLFNRLFNVRYDVLITPVFSRDGKLRREVLSDHKTGALAELYLKRVFNEVGFTRFVRRVIKG